MTHFHLRGFLLVAGTVGLAGCAALTSEMPETLQRRGEAPSGLHYNLPMARMPLMLSVDPARGQFTVTSGALEWLPDPVHRYYIQHRPLPQFEDEFTLKLNAKGTFLHQVTLNTKDKTLAIAHDLARAFGGFGLESAILPVKDDQLDRQIVDPSDPDDLRAAAQRFNKKIREYAKTHKAAACKPVSKDKDADVVLKHALCEEYTALTEIKPQQKKTDPVIFVSPDPVALSVSTPGTPLPQPTATDRAQQVIATLETAPGRARTSLADCRVGICYRPPQAFTIKVTVQNASRRQVVFVPNRSPLVEIDLYRTFLASGNVGPDGKDTEKATTHTIVFSEANGLLESMRVEKNSELLALASLPLAITQGIIAGLALRLKVTQNEVKSVDAQRQLLEQRVLLANERAKFESAIALRGGYAAQSGSVAGQSRVPVFLPTPVTVQQRATSFIEAQKNVDSTR